MSHFSPATNRPRPPLMAHHRRRFPSSALVLALLAASDGLVAPPHRVASLLPASSLWMGVSVTEAMAAMSSTAGPHPKVNNARAWTFFSFFPFISSSPAPALCQAWADPTGTTMATPALGPGDIKIVTYNCLGPLHGEGSKHDYAAVSITKWTRRRDRLLDEIRGLDADIYCLQEISAKALRETFIPNLKHVGLECFGFAPSKPDDKVRGKYGHKHVGCAIFGRSTKFNLIASKRVHLRDYGPLQGCRSHRFHVDFVNKWNALALLMVQIKATGQPLCVGNTHLFWNPARADIKAAQTCAAMDAVNHFCQELGYPKGQQPPLVLCGDFNTVPDMGLDASLDGYTPSAPFHLLEHGALPIDHPQHPDTFYPKVEVIPGKPGHGGPENPRLGAFSTGWAMRNVYALPEFTPQRPLFSTKTDDFQGWIDHVWVSEGVDVAMVLSPPIRSGDLEASLKARQFSPIPNRYYPSDHLPLGAVVRVKEGWGAGGHVPQTPLGHARALQQQAAGAVAVDAAPPAGAAEAAPGEEGDEDEEEGGGGGSDDGDEEE